MSKNLNHNLRPPETGDRISNDPVRIDLDFNIASLQHQVQLEDVDKIIAESKELLKKSFFDFESLFGSSSQAYLLVDNDLIIRNFNKTALRNFNLILKKNLSISSSITEIIGKDIYHNFYEFLEKVFSGESVNTEFSFNDFNGESMWFQMNISPVKEEEGPIGLVLISINNISVHANRSISILESITDGMFALDKEWKFTYLNTKAEKMIRRKREELIGKNIWQEFNINNESVFYLNYQKAITYKKEVHFEEYSYFMGGWLEVHGYPSKEGISIYFRSINERKEAEEKQKESEEWFKAVLATSRDGFAVELGGELIYMNTAFLDLFDYSHDEVGMLGNIPVSQFYEEEIKAVVSELSVSTTKGDQVQSIYETKGKKKDGSFIDLEISASVLNMKDKNYIIILARDITIRKKAEIQLIDQNAELLKINAELDRFVYSASHDLRAPLMSILGLINISKVATKESANLEYLDLMTKSIHKLDKFVQDIIHYSRNSRLALNNEIVDFQSLINESLGDVEYIENFSKIKKIIDIDQHALFFSDASRVTIIFNNIFSNAIRYCNLNNKESFIKISIKVDLDNAYIEVEDNGKGIATQHVNHIFGMFYRASETNVGSGLGLYIVKETIVKLGGDIQVHSTFGEGTKFNIVIPNMVIQ